MSQRQRIANDLRAIGSRIEATDQPERLLQMADEIRMIADELEDVAMATDAAWKGNR